MENCAILCVAKSRMEANKERARMEEDESLVEQDDFLSNFSIYTSISKTELILVLFIR